jgi:RNA polymerase sigma-70 factor, ECF subfamily
MDRLEIFNRHRSLLFAIAYRMLGTTTDAEDMLQEAWIRWQSTQTVVQSPKKFLSTIITRLCIDRLRSARVQREQYVGIWLPEPLITESIDNTGNSAELAESLSFAFLTLLECLSPTERAIFLLRDVFDYDYSDIAKTVGKSIPNCRQIVRRARQHLILRRPSISISVRQKEETIEQFLASWNQGDVHQLIALMAEDITFWSDGGGLVTAAQHPLQGNQKVARFLVAIRHSPLIPTLSPRIVQINDRPGILNTVAGKPQSTFSFEFSGDRIQSIFAVANPDKLKAVKL